MSAAILLLSLSTVGAPPCSLDGPDLATVLGTDARGVQLLREEMKQHPGTQLVDAWTSLIVRHNRPSPSRAPWLGSILFAGGAAILALSGVTGVLGILMTTAALPGLQAHRFSTDPAGAGRVAPAFPWLAAVFWDLSFTLPMAAGILAAAAIPFLPSSPPLRVASTGACRDEARLERSFSPSGAQRAAPYLAALGGLAGILGTLGYLAAAGLTWPIISVVTQAGVSTSGPSIALSGAGTWLALTVASAVFMVGFWLATVPFGSAALVTSLVMMYRRDPSPFSDGN